MIPKNKSFPRGYEFSNFQGQPEGDLIQIELPANVAIPLKQGFGNEVPPLVQQGQKVAAGEIIGRDDQSVSSPVHSSVNGKVLKIEKTDLSGTQTEMVTIQSDGTAGWKKLEGFSPNLETLPVDKIGELIYLSGAASCGKAGIPTKFNSSVIVPEQVENVIIQGVDSEVHNLSLDILLRDQRLAHFIQGLKILKKFMGGAKFHLVLNKSQKDLIGQISRQLPGDNSINLFTVPPKYPVSSDEVLTQLLLNTEFPYGYSAANIGVIVLDVQTVLHVYDAVAQGKPLIETTAALCGPGFTENPHFNFRIGCSIEHIIKGKVDTDKNLRFVLNSCLTGQKLSDLSLPAERTLKTLIAMVEENESEFLAFARPGFKRDSYSRTCFSEIFKKGGSLFQKTCGTNLHGELRPCISCNFCQEICPVGIMPHILFQHVERDIIDENLLRYKIFNCIECNLCSYVCPSKIPIVDFIKKGKAGLIKEGFKIPEPEGELKGVEKYKSVK